MSPGHSAKGVGLGLTAKWTPGPGSLFDHSTVCPTPRGCPGLEGDTTSRLPSTHFVLGAYLSYLTSLLLYEGK